MQKDKFKELVSQINGLCYEDTCYILYSLVSSLSDIKADILEIGAYKGRVSISLALAVKEKNMPSKVFSLDVNYFNTKKEFIYNIKRFGLENIIFYIFKPSSLVNIGWRRPLKFIFIDTEGKYFSAKCDFILWERFLVKNGIFAISCADNLEIKRFFDKFVISSKRFKNYQKINNILFAYKENERLLKAIDIFYIWLIYTFYISLKKIFYLFKYKKLFR